MQYACSSQLNNKCNKSNHSIKNLVFVIGLFYNTFNVFSCNSNGFSYNNVECFMYELGTKIPAAFKEILYNRT